MIYSEYEINAGAAEKSYTLFPKQRGNITVDTSRFLGAVISIRENGGKWRPLLCRDQSPGKKRGA
jgi:hypothetical protein